MKYLNINTITLFFSAFFLCVCLNLFTVEAQQLRIVETYKKSQAVLFIKIPDPVTPQERIQKYEKPLNDYLLENDLGEIAGSGTFLTADRKIDYVGIDIDIYDQEKALPLIIQKLKDLNVPQGTVIEQLKPVAKLIPLK